MGLLDYNLDTPEGQGLLSAAFSLLGAQKMPGQRGSMGPALADAGRQFMGTSESARNAALQRKLTQTQIDENEYQNRARAAALAAAERKRAALPGLYGRGGSLTSPGIGIAPAQGGQSANIDYLAALQAGYTPDEIQKLSTLPNAGRAEVARTVEVMENGRPVTRQLDKFGQLIGEGLGVYKAPVFQNLGGRTVAIDPVTMREAGSFAQSMSPSERDASARGWATVNQGRVPAGYRPSADGMGLEFIPGGPADPAAAKKAAPTEFQGKSASYGARAQEADRIISSLEGKYSPAALNAKLASGQVWGVGGALESAGNLALSAEGQKAEQAQRDFINAVLRQESGAAISQGEFENARKQYFPQPFDSKAVKEQKSANRKMAIQGFLNNARPGAVPQTGATGSFDEPSNDPLGIRK